MQKMKTNRARVTGFTLIEVMVVVVILGILASLVVVSVAGNTDKARVTAARSDLSAIAQALDLFKLDNFNYPSTDQGLEALVHAPEGARNFPQGGYLKKLPVDPWGHPYQYFSPGSNGAFDLLSYGADGAEGGEGAAEDIVFQ
mgnify:CR=1 FL=1